MSVYTRLVRPILFRAAAENMHTTGIPAAQALSASEMACRAVSVYCSLHGRHGADLVAERLVRSRTPMPAGVNIVNTNRDAAVPRTDGASGGGDITPHGPQMPFRAACL